MRETPTTDGDDVPEDVDVLDPENPQATNPLVQLFGTHAKTKILAVLAKANRPLGVTSICESAGLGDRHSWYDHRDDLLESGLVVEAGKEGNSTLYALADPDDDARTDWLEALHDFTAAHYRDGETRPQGGVRLDDD